MGETAQVVEKYADKLVGLVGDTAPEAWALLVQAEIVTGMQLLLSFLVVSVASSGCLWLSWNSHKGLRIANDLTSLRHKTESLRESRDGWLIATAFLVLSASLFLGAGAGHLYAPESYALQSLMSNIK